MIELCSQEKQHTRSAYDESLTSESVHTTGSVVAQ